MKKIIRLTESDLNRIVERVIKEQGALLGLASRASAPNLKNPSVGRRMPSPESDEGTIGPDGFPICNDKDYSELVYELFTHILKTPPYSIYIPKNGEKISEYSSDFYIINYIRKLKSLMDGIGGNKGVLEIFSKLTLKDFSTIINNWKEVTGSNKSLYDWLKDEWGISWKEVWDSIGSFKNKFNIDKKKCGGKKTL